MLERGAGREGFHARNVTASAAAIAHQQRSVASGLDTDSLLDALKHIASQGTPQQWAPKAPAAESDAESIAGLPPGDTPRAWHLSHRFDSTFPGEDEEGGAEALRAVDEDTHRTGSGRSGDVGGGAED